MFFDSLAVMSAWHPPPKKSHLTLISPEQGLMLVHLATPMLATVGALSDAHHRGMRNTQLHRRGALRLFLPLNALAREHVLLLGGGGSDNMFVASPNSTFSIHCVISRVEEI